ncbi:heparinase II/III family protein [Blastochloris tepida]|uniref:Heparinase n=1 Tax=Blastochloris tepida TaxID=2233851 RepID=A0A348G5A3_9HYPH|nr:heparinase II/III family protein [Blastochloris tepida]BBF94736.1 heparinase [Blastochloris tepida]
MARARTGLFVAERLARDMRASWAASRLVRWRYGAGSLDRLVIAPQDLRTADPTNASEIYAGHFAFAGKMVAVNGRSPFEMPAPSQEWAEELMSFAWLRHLRAAGTAIAQQNARALIDEWIHVCGGYDPRSWEPTILSRRVISWLAHAPMILENADHDFYRRFLRSLLKQVRFLRKVSRDAQDGYPRLVSAIALSFAGLCMAGQGRLLKVAQRRLAHELGRQILPDGVHVSRNPGVLVELLLDLLPLRQAFAARSVPPDALMNAIDRTMPMLRFFRHRDGTLGNFNGMGATAADHLATLLAYDDARGRPIAAAPHGGYQRMEAGSTVVLMDTGPPPPIAVAGEAHAGCLSFEMSVGRHRLVVNCGVPTANRAAWRAAARATAAHSTAVLADTSSCRFLTGGFAESVCGTPIVDGPHDVRAARSERADSIMVRASHDGYAPRFGVLHQRSLRLTADGSRLDGEDVFQDAAAHIKVEDDDFAIRFHLHPAVKVSPIGAGESLLLVLPDRDSWMFAVHDLKPVLEESVYLGATDGPRRTVQIVLHGRLRTSTRIRWTFIRTDAGMAAGRPA